MIAITCGWCGKLAMAGDWAFDPRPGRDGERMHVRCASECKNRRLAWADLSKTPGGEVVMLVDQLLNMIRGAGGSMLVEVASGGFQQMTDAIARAKGEKP